MTDHKPFTAEQLDGFMHREATVEDFERLIAQAREEIRLRESDVVLSALAFLAGCFGVGYRVEEIFRLARERGWEQPEECAAARAKRELGEWLVTDYRRAFLLVEPDGTDWFCMLWLTYDRGEDAPDFEGSGPTEHEAITAALRAAKGKR